MTESKTNITYRVLTETEQKLVALARSAYRKPGATVDMLVADAWQAAKDAGLVTDDMLITTLPRPEGAQIVPVITIAEA